ncbi:zinc finger protein 131 [Alosa sapidissima]|uniref:zinc finger protein 131 n=1 Tax=Alosa sapidissima TaxID=34773 RepID=UPI001C096186|nr:zinc finger protein 131 [Alosa sapidissima]XP_041926319.1 zinc finger protein 131 [Alosa sapidissima]XP_041926320.1 zinc finger protein 131 [Alosa sapidissima]XP_041926321.1 zinc finger protein 131 [Alosa sapidissima]
MADEGVVECGHEFPAHYKVMLDKLNEQRQLDQFTDITLIVDGHQFRAHKAVLAACSQFFHKFFQDFKQEPLVEIEGVSNSAFQHLMEFTYTATLSVNGSEEVSDVWRAAEYLQMQEAIKALNTRINGSTSLVSTPVLAGKSKAKKRKIAETSNVITETLPSVEAETVEIEVEVGGVEDASLEEVVDAAARNAQASSDDSALALLADITSKYRPGETALQGAGADKSPELAAVAAAAVVDEEELVLQEETVMAPKALESIEVVEVQISQLDNMFRCDKCDRCFKIFYHLKQHMKSHEAAGEGGGGSKPFVCRHCGKAYAREGALKQHLNSYHYEAEEQSRRQRPQKKVHVCEYCDKQFDHFGHFKEHLRKHTGEKPFECPDCHERFARNSTLKCHMAACQNGCGAKKGRKKLYECQVCNSVFNSWDQFKDHLVIHTGEKPNHCTFCDLWFTQPRDLRIHLRDLHGIQDDAVTSTTAGAAEEVVLTEASAATTVLSTSTGEVTEEEAGLLLTTEDGIRVEHVTVEPMDVVAVEETLVVEAEEEEEGAVAVVTHPGEEAAERLNEHQTVEIQVGEVTHVTMTDEHLDSDVHVETVEVDDSGEVQTVQV